MNVASLGIVPSGLGPRILNPKVRLCIRSNARAPLPAPIVARNLPIHEVPEEGLLSEPPGTMEILAKEHRDNHPHPIVHESSGAKLAHPSVDDREASFSSCPLMKGFTRLFPRNSAELRKELTIEHVGVVPEYLHVEVAPGEFADEPVDTFLH